MLRKTKEFAGVPKAELGLETRCQGKLASLSDSLTATHKWACAINAPRDTLLWQECSPLHTTVGRVLPMTHCCGNSAPQPPRKVCVSRKLCHRQCVLKGKSRDVQTPELSITYSQGPKPLVASTGSWLSRGCPILLSTAVSLGTGHCEV